jgi:hypothetical protein
MENINLMLNFKKQVINTKGNPPPPHCSPRLLECVVFTVIHTHLEKEKAH